MKKRNLLSGAAAAGLRPGMMMAPRNDSAQPSLTEIRDLTNQAMQAVTALREDNDKVLAEIKAKGSADAVAMEKVDRINNDVGKLSDQIDKIVNAQKAEQAWRDQMEAVLGRQALQPGSGGDDVTAQAERMSAIITARCGREIKMSADDFKEYRDAITNLVRKGPDRVTDKIKNVLSVGSDQNGGYLVDADRQARILKRLFDTSPVRQHASVIATSSDKIEFPIDANDATSGGWVSEQGTRDGTATPDLGLHVIELHEQYAEPHVTQKMLEDSAFDVEGWLSAKIADKFRRTENAGFVNGNGVGKPRGFMSYSDTAVTTDDATRAWKLLQYVVTGTSGAFGSGGADALIDLTYKLKPEYHPGAIFAAARSTFAAVRKLKNGAGDYLWSMGNIAQGQASTLLGFGAVAFDDMAAIGANSFSLAFGNFAEGYVVADRLGMTILRDPFTSKPKVKFYSRKRVGGDVVNFDAIKLLKFGAS